MSSDNKPFVRSLTFYKGQTYDDTFTWKTGPQGSEVPVNLTGCTARMHIRKTIKSVDPIIELTNANGRIILGGADGTIRFLVSDEDTAAIAEKSGVYDCEIEFPNGSVRKLLSGKVKFQPEVTR